MIEYTVTRDPASTELTPFKVMPLECEVSYELSGDVTQFIKLVDDEFIIQSDDLSMVRGYKLRTVRGKLLAFAGDKNTEVDIQLKLMNPCYDSELIRIITGEVDVIPDYTVLTLPQFYTFKPFTVIKESPRLQHVVKINGKNVAFDSNPVAYDPIRRKITIFAATDDYQGV